MRFTFVVAMICILQPGLQNFRIILVHNSDEILYHLHIYLRVPQLKRKNRYYSVVNFSSTLSNLCPLIFCLIVIFLLVDSRVTKYNKLRSTYFLSIMSYFWTSTRLNEFYFEVYLINNSLNLRGKDTISNEKSKLKETVKE